MLENDSAWVTLANVTMNHPPEYELIEYFAVFPRQLDSGVPFFYNNNTFVVSSAIGERVSVVIEPSEGFVEIAAKHEERDLFCGVFSRVSAIRIDDDWMQFDFISDSDVKLVRFKFRSAFAVQVFMKQT